MNVNRSPRDSDDLRETYRIVNAVNQKLHHYSLVCIPIIVNSLTICLKLKQDEPTNSNLLIVRSGLGKTTLLHHIIAKSNPKYVISLPDKIFESMLVDCPESYFHGKVWILDDLITSFRGLSTKQKEQLMGFFNSILSKKRYERQSKKAIENVKVSCMFGMASENYLRYTNNMFFATFLERIVPVQYDFDSNAVKEICGMKLESARVTMKSEMPKVKLPFKSRNVNIGIPRDLDSEILDLTMPLQSFQGLSGTRALTYIQNFAKANAYLNERDAVTCSDLNLLKLILPLHKGIKSGDIETRIRELILHRSMENQCITGRDIKNNFKGEYSESTISEVLSSLRADIPYRKKSSGRGYDYEYFI